MKRRKEVSEIKTGTYQVIVSVHAMIAKKTELEFPDYPKIMAGERKPIFGKHEVFMPKVLFEISRAGNCVNPDYVRDACQKDVGLMVYSIKKTDNTDGMILLESETYSETLFQALIMPLVL
jgi:hypothetical protein